MGQREWFPSWQDCNVSIRASRSFAFCPRSRLCLTIKSVI